jgi:hypothetical protein
MRLSKRGQRADYTIEAEALIRRVCERHALIAHLETAPIELLMVIPVQNGLSRSVSVGLQNNDELNLGIGHFWSYFFPFEDKKHLFEAALEGFILGDYRVAEHSQRGRRPYKCTLERRTENGWEPFYSGYSGLKLPFVKSTVTYLLNDARTAHAS